MKILFSEAAIFRVHFSRVLALSAIFLFSQGAGSAQGSGVDGFVENLPGRWRTFERIGEWQGESEYIYRSDGTFEATVRNFSFALSTGMQDPHLSITGKWSFDKGVFIREFSAVKHKVKAFTQKDAVLSVTPDEFRFRSDMDGSEGSQKRVKEYLFLDGPMLNSDTQESVDVFLIVSLFNGKIVGFDMARRTSVGLLLRPGIVSIGESSGIVTCFSNIFPERLLHFETQITIPLEGLPQIRGRAGREIPKGMMFEGRYNPGLNLREKED